MIESVIQPTGNKPGSIVINDGGILRAVGYYLASIEDIFIVSQDGYYIDLGMINGEGPTDQNLAGGAIGTTTIQPGNMV